MKSPRIIRKFIILIYLFSILLPVVYLFNNNIIVSNEYGKNLNLYKPKNSGYWDLTGTPILIDDLDPTKNWAYTAANYPWINGSGTWSDPYRIENVIIDGLFEGSCIYILNSEVPFIIQNSTLVNIGRGANQYDSAIRLYNVSNGLILNNNCSNNNGNGFYLVESSNNTIINNIANNNEQHGLQIRYSNTNNFSGNIFNYNEREPIGMYDSHFNSYIGNTIIQLELDSTWSNYPLKEIVITGHNNSFSANIMNNTGFYLRWEDPLNDLSSHVIDKSNLVNNKPVYYYVKEQFLTRDNFSNAGQVILVDCDNSEISNLTISNGVIGIGLYYSNNSLVFNNTITFHRREEIFAYKSTQNTISYNIIKNVGISTGIHTRHSNGELISNNHITDCNNGIDISKGNNHNLSTNFLIGNNMGIYISHSTSFVRIMGNTIINSSQIGAVDIGSNNTYYLNKFIGNNKHAIDYNTISYWDNGTIGNYWDNYTGQDINDDGIGETPHLIPNFAGSQDNFPIWDDGHNGSKIIIDEYSSYNWKWAITKTWASGSGTYRDPYVIRNVIVDGNKSGDCITIKNSNAYFRIENSTVYNSQYKSGIDYAGIKLVDTTNGTIIDSNSSFNDDNGILLDGCNNITIKNSIFNNNGWEGILTKWGSYNISIINNTINNNKLGIYLSGGSLDKIIDNTLKDNAHTGIGLNPGYSNIIKHNIITRSSSGIDVWGDNNTFSYNHISYSHYGLEFKDSTNWNNIIANNTISYQYSHGIYLQGADSRYNLFYNNSLVDNINTAFDDGYNNYWDNGIIGNYWSDYTGKDIDDNGIGDIPHIITGLAGSIDHFPLWWDPPVLSLNSPKSFYLFDENPPEFNISVYEGVLNSSWYTLNNGTEKFVTKNLFGTINHTLWNLIPNGTVSIKFYVNDSLNFIGFVEVVVRKDTLGPLITINSPIQGVYGWNSPNYDITVIDGNLESTWYRLSNKTDNTDNISIFTSSGQTDENLWNLFGNDTVRIQFFANDTFGHIGYSETVMFKDLFPPIITIINPLYNETFGNQAPTYEISVEEPNLLATWYTIGEGFANTSINSFTGTFDQSFWDTLQRGQFNITFYCIDKAGNTAYKEILINKEQNSPLESSPPNNDQIFTIISFSVIIGGSVFGVSIIIRAVYKRSLDKPVLEEYKSTVFVTKKGLLFCPKCFNKINYGKDVICPNCGYILKRS